MREEKVPEEESSASKEEKRLLGKIGVLGSTSTPVIENEEKKDEDDSG